MIFLAEGIIDASRTESTEDVVGTAARGPAVFHRAVLHHLGRNRLMPFHPVAVGTHHVQRVRRYREAEHDRQALRAVGRARERAESPGIAGDVLEQDRRRRLAAVDDLGERAHLQLPVRAADPQQLAGVLEALDGLS